MYLHELIDFVGLRKQWGLFLAFFWGGGWGQISWLKSIEIVIAISHLFQHCLLFCEFPLSFRSCSIFSSLARFQHVAREYRTERLRSFFILSSFWTDLIAYWCGNSHSVSYLLSSVSSFFLFLFLAFLGGVCIFWLFYRSELCDMKQACAKRIEGDETGTKHCTGQYFDYLSCIDKCVSSQISLLRCFVLWVTILIWKRHLWECRLHQNYLRSWNDGYPGGQNVDAN